MKRHLCGVPNERLRALARLRIPQAHVLVLATRDDSAGRLPHARPAVSPLVIGGQPSGVEREGGMRASILAMPPERL